MNPEFPGPPDPHDDVRIGQDMCRAVGAAEFDYAALVEGVHHRAGRIRRRRALTTGAIVAVFGPALLGGSALVLPDLLPRGVEGTVTPLETPVAVLTDPAEPAPLSEGQSGVASADEAERAREAQAPPWQDETPPLPADGVDGADSGNAWEIPDARPTGVDYMDDFGAPTQGIAYQRTVPIFHVMVGNTGEEGQRPEAGQSWSYSYEDSGWDAGALDIHITGWADSVAARDAIRDETMTTFVRIPEGPWQQQAWAEHEGDDDYLLHTATYNGLQFGFALVRQGDYLIGVTVTDTTGEVNAEVAAEIASKTADNMQALDPVHGRD